MKIYFFLQCSVSTGLKCYKLNSVIFLQQKNNSSLFYYTLNYNLFLWCKAEFSSAIASVSHEPSEINAKRPMLIWYYQIWKQLLL